MIVVTGAAGFIGSCLVGKMNTKGFGDITIVDDFSNPQKNLNLKSKPYRQQVHRDKFIMWLKNNHSSVIICFISVLERILLNSMWMFLIN